MNDELSQSMIPLRQLGQHLWSYAPQVFLFIGVLLSGFLASSVAKRVARWIMARSGLETLAEKFGIAKLLYAVGFRHGFAQAVGVVVYWAGLLLTAAACAEVAGLNAIASGVGVLLSFLPRLVAAAVVLTGGFALGSAVQTILTNLGRRRGDVDDPRAIGRFAQYLIVTVAVIMAADQAGLETDLVDVLVIMTVGVCLASLGLAFGFASRTAFANLVAGHYVKRAVMVGDVVEYQGSRGTVLRYTPVFMVLRVDDSEILVPFRDMLEQPITLHPVNESRSEHQT